MSLDISPWTSVSFFLFPAGVLIVQCLPVMLKVTLFNKHQDFARTFRTWYKGLQEGLPFWGGFFSLLGILKK